MNFTYMKTPLYRHTFRNKRIREWVEDRVEAAVLNLYCGPTQLDCAEIRNDIDSEIDAHYHMDALELVKALGKDNFDTIILDPPYSYRKSMEMYNGNVSSPFNQLKNEIPRILSDKGIVITFGYHSVSMGKTRGFEQEEILLMSHGGAIHDTIAVIERRILP